MTLVKWKNRHRPSIFNNTPSIFNLMDDLFLNFDSPSVLHSATKTTAVPSVNIVEDKDNYRLEIAAPGWKKEDFSIQVEQQILTISGQHKSETADGNVREKYTHREFTQSSFKRSFTLPENIDVENIKAEYENGILFLHLPKVEDIVETPVNIEIA